MNIPSISHRNVSPRLMNLMKKDSTRRIGNVIEESLPNGHKIYSYPDGTKTVFDSKGNRLMTQFTIGEKTYIKG